MSIIIDFQNYNKELEGVLLLSLSCVFGGIIGYQRRNVGTVISLSAYCTIAMGSCMFTIISGSFSSGDPSRMASAIIQGVGFLGAGVIMKDTENDRVKGITTGATIWAVAAIGMCIGFKLYILAVFGTSVIYILTRTGGYKVISKDSIEELKSGMEQIKQEVTLDKNN